MFIQSRQPTEAVCLKFESKGKEFSLAVDSFHLKPETELYRTQLCIFTKGGETECTVDDPTDETFLEFLAGFYGYTLVEKV